MVTFGDLRCISLQWDRDLSSASVHLYRHLYSSLFPCLTDLVLCPQAVAAVAVSAADGVVLAVVTADGAVAVMAVAVAVADSAEVAADSADGAADSAEAGSDSAGAEKRSRLSDEPSCRVGWGMPLPLTLLIYVMVL